MHLPFVITSFASPPCQMMTVLHFCHQKRQLTSRLGKYEGYKIRKISTNILKGDMFLTLRISLDTYIGFSNNRRLKKLDPSSGLVDETSTWKLDLYFQQYSGQQLHSSMESVLKRATPQE